MAFGSGLTKMKRRNVAVTLGRYNPVTIGHLVSVVSNLTHWDHVTVGVLELTKPSGVTVSNMWVPEILAPEFRKFWPVDVMPQVTSGRQVRGAWSASRAHRA